VRVNLGIRIVPLRIVLFNIIGSAMTKLTPTSDRNSFLAGIGHVCLQWALLEQTILAIIASAENMPLEKTYPRFGTLDMMPRLNMAIKLAHEASWPVRLTKPLAEIRKAVQREGEGLADRRNLFVHGVHAETDVAGEFELTMVRWAPEKRRQVVTIVDAVDLATRLHLLVKKAEAVFDGYGVWKFGTKRDASSDGQIATSLTRLRLVRAYNIKRALKLLFANLKPW
jgi:hypothetical protein